MTKDEIIKMARDAGSIDSEDVIETVWAAFSAAEREDCSWVCTDEANKCELDSLSASLKSDRDKCLRLREASFRLSICAENILARGKK